MDSPPIGPTSVNPAKIDRLNIDPTQVIERISLVTPLGLRFWDAVSGKVIGDGLIVTAYPEANPHRRIQAFSNYSGLYVLSKLPGLHEFGTGKGDKEFWDFQNENSPKLAFIIEIQDTESRFLPFLLRVNVPLRGLFPWEDPFGTSPPAGAVGVPLYSSPTRAVPAGMAVMRAELHEWQPGAEAVGDPAAWAVIEARINRRPWARGIADDHGRIVLIFPYPEPLTNSLVSPPGAIRTAVQEQEWRIELVAAYSRLSPVRSVPGAQPILELSDVLTQRPALLWADSQRGRLFDEVTLKFGRELVVRSIDPIEGVPTSVVFITPAGSPP